MNPDSAAGGTLSIFEEKNFSKQLGSTATVQRDSVSGDLAEVSNRKLADLGRELNPVAENLQYMGSMACHVYWNQTLGQFFTVNQTRGMLTHKCPEKLAQAAAKDLLGTLIETYGHRRPKLRSGF